MEWVAVCLEDFGQEVAKWNEPGMFPPGEQTFLRLIELSKTVDAAVFIFSGDDRIWYRGDAAHRPRDNVLIEYGLFAGQLGPTKCIFCLDGISKTSADLRGLTYVDIASKRRNRARAELRIWANNLTSKPVDQATIQIMAKLAEKERELELAHRRIRFGGDATQQLESLLTKHGIVDFASYDLDGDGQWKLLFEFEYFWNVAQELEKMIRDPRELREILIDGNAGKVAESINWSDFESDQGHTGFFIRKALRVFREILEPAAYVEFLESTTESLRAAIRQTAQMVLLRKQTGGNETDV